MTKYIIRVGRNKDLTTDGTTDLMVVSEAAGLRADYRVDDVCMVI